MSMEQQFRSAVMGGFNKQDVLNYIENSVKTHIEEMNQLREELERVRQESEDALSQARKEGKAALERAEAAEAKVAELTPRAAQMEKSTAELEAKRSALAAAEREVKQLHAKVAELAPKAEAYDAVKEKTAGIELEAHQRARAVMDEAKRNAENIRLQTEQWMGKVQGSYDRLRGELEVTMNNTAREMERTVKALSAIGDQFAAHDAAIQAVADTQKSAPLCYGRVDTEGSSLNMRSAPGTHASKVASIPSNTVVAVDGMKDGWFKVKYNGKTGYVSGEYILAVSSDNTRRDDPVQTKAPAVSTPSTPSTPSAPSAEASALGEQIVAYAKEFLGVPYVYGANGPNSFDCSSFTKYVFKNFGYSLTRSAASQLSDGVGVKMEDIQVGDIICWRKYGSSKAATHVGIYIGNGEYIHASSSGSVRINEMSYGSSVRYVVGVRRII